MKETIKFLSGNIEDSVKNQNLTMDQADYLLSILKDVLVSWRMGQMDTAEVVGTIHKVAEYAGITFNK